MRHTLFRKAAQPLTRRFFRMRYWFNSRVSTIGYDHVDFTPLQVYWISPTSVSKMMLPGEELTRKCTPGVVVGGNWDQKTKPFVDSIYYRSFKRRFVEDVPWEETSLFKSAINRSSGNLWHNCSTEEEVKAKLSEYSDIYQSIKHNGYLTQRELQDQGMVTQTLVPPEKNEIRINIDRDGSLIFDEGRHRFAISKILGINEIPVIIVGVHEKWIKSGGAIDNTPSITYNKKS